MSGGRVRHPVPGQMPWPLQQQETDVPPDHPGQLERLPQIYPLPKDTLNICSPHD